MYLAILLGVVHAKSTGQQCSPWRLERCQSCPFLSDADPATKNRLEVKISGVSLWRSLTSTFRGLLLARYYLRCSRLKDEADKEMGLDSSMRFFFFLARARARAPYHMRSRSQGRSACTFGAQYFYIPPCQCCLPGAP